MNHILYLITILFSSTTIYSQDFDFLKKRDTIYIVFEGTGNEKKYNLLTPTNYDEKFFRFAYSENRPDLIFEHTEYKNRNKRKKNITSEIKKVNQSFLDKNKNKIISRYLLVRYKYEYIVCEILSLQKTLYIIDYTEKEDNKITLYEVVLTNPCLSIE